MIKLASPTLPAQVRRPISHRAAVRAGLNPSRKCASKAPAFDRRVCRQQTTPAGLAIFKTKSFSNEVDTYHPIVNLENFAVRCDCKGFHFHYEKHEPTIWDVQYHCQHIARAIVNLRRRGELPLLQPMCGHGPLEDHHCASMEACSLCGQPAAEYQMCGDGGEEMHGYRICANCVFGPADDMSNATPEGVEQPWDDEADDEADVEGNEEDCDYDPGDREILRHGGHIAWQN